MLGGSLFLLCNREQHAPWVSLTVSQSERRLCNEKIWPPGGSFTRRPWWLSGKELAWQCRRCRRQGFDLWVGKFPWRREWQSIPVFLPGKSHGQRSLAGYRPGGCKELNRTEWLTKHTHFSGGRYIHHSRGLSKGYAEVGLYLEGGEQEDSGEAAPVCVNDVTL